MKPRIVCVECGGEISPGERFCGGCGVAIDWSGIESANVKRESVRCSLCGAINDVSNNVCSSCGERITGKSETLKKQAIPPQSKQAPPKKKSIPERHPWLKMTAFIAFIVVGVLFLEYITGSDRQSMVVQQDHEHDHDHPELTSANMAVLPQIEDMEKRVAANPNDIKLLLSLANFLHDNRFYDKAIQNYKRYLEKNPKDADARVDLGICYSDLNNFDEARKHMQDALRFEPKHVMAHFNLGIVNLRAGDVEKSNEWFKKTAELDPNSPVGQRAKQFLREHEDLLIQK